MAEQLYRYRAFISYRHVPHDRKWARWLVEKLETYRTPRALVRVGAPVRIGHLYRDDDEVPASSDLSHEIENSLRESQFLIVVCSPDTPGSKWVHKEIEFFRSLGRGDRILALLVEGEPGESFPADLLRVLVETTNADGSRAAEWVEREPIASDVRPRPDERRSVTERRAFLRIAAGLLGVGYDDLVQRERQRRVLRGRLWGTAAAALAIAIAVGGYRYWDYTTPHTRYYADFGMRWGVPFGIGELSAETASHRSVSFAIDTLKGHVTDMRRQNGSGQLVAAEKGAPDFEEWTGAVAEWRLPFPADKAVEVDLYDDAHMSLVDERYSFGGNGDAVVSFSGRNGNSAAQSARDVTDPEGGFASKSIITQHHLQFDGSGFLVSRTFQTQWGDPANDSEGIYVKQYRHDPSGRTIAIWNTDQRGRAVEDGANIAHMTFEFDASGAVVRIDRYNASGKIIAESVRGNNALGNNVWEEYHGRSGIPILGAKKFFRKTQEFNDKGSPVRTAYYGISGKPVFDDDGFAIQRDEYDAKGQVVRERYFDAQGRPTLNKRHLAEVDYSYDGRGRIAELSYFGARGEPVRDDNGCWRLAVRYDSDGNTTREECRDASGRPTLNFEDIAGTTSSYNANGRVIEDRSFGLHGETVRRSLGYAIGRFVYDERGNLKELKFFDVDGKPAADSDGVSEFDATYDERGQIHSLVFRGPDGRLVLHKKEGTAGMVSSYDRRGNVTETVFLGIDNRPAPTTQGVTIVKSVYDGRGNEIQRDGYDAAGKLVVGKAGFAREKNVFDDRNHLIAESYYGADGKPMLSTGGYFLAKVRYNSLDQRVEIAYFDIREKAVADNSNVAREIDSYDERGQLLAVSVLDADGRPALSKDGYSKMVFQRDDRGNPVRQSFFGPDGKPIMTRLGFAARTDRYDARNRIVEETYFDVMGKPVAAANGNERVTLVYDNRGGVKKRTAFGPDGRPIVAKK